jgi:plasmid stability protein
MTEQRKGGSKKHRRTKDKVLQARIPDDLDEELRDRAATLGLSVSTIVRNVLMHTFNLVEGVVTDSAQLVGLSPPRGQSLSPRERPAADSADPAQPQAVIAWQQAALNLNAVCDQCNTVLRKGEQAAIGLPITSRPAFLCLDCLNSLTPGDGGDSTKE